jgi:hypothetical protein
MLSSLFKSKSFFQSMIYFHLLSVPAILSFNVHSQTESQQTFGSNPCQYDIIVGDGPNGVIKIDTQNYLFCTEGSQGQMKVLPRPFCSSIAELILARPVQTQDQINQQLTQSLRQQGMSFTEKDNNGKNTYFDVPVNGVPMVLTKKTFNTLVKSTAPVLRAKRFLDQLFYSVDKNKFTEDFVFNEIQTYAAQTNQKLSCDKDTIKSMITSMKGSIYDLAALHHPNMKDYPFLAISGVDALISDPEDDQSAVFAEFNLGTPSGISNVRYAASALLKHDPVMAKKLHFEKLLQDQTYSLLKNTIEENARAWTGTKPGEGITVMVGPGKFNGAHPDVSSISYFSGMPLVERKDLYLDEAGNLRLLISNDPAQCALNPRVIGIYSRSEESFLLNNENSPFISPYNDHNQKTFNEIIAKDAEKYGHLKGEIFPEGVSYQWIYENSSIIGVNLDASGKPKTSVLVGDSLGQDPCSKNKNLDLIKAIVSRKLFTNVIGGRVVDDKKVFELASKCLAPMFNPEKGPIAGPPKSYTPSEFVPLLNDASDAELGGFVMKLPDGSSGKGVYILANYPEKERRDIVNELLGDEKLVQRIVVQDFVRAAAMTMPMAGKEGVERYYKPSILEEVDQEKLNHFKPAYLPQANDLRIFTMMDSQGNVKADNLSVLIRTAKPTITDLNINGDPRSNTGVGGGYGILSLVGDENNGSETTLNMSSKKIKSLAAKLLVTKVQSKTPLPLNKKMDFLKLLEQMLNVKNYIHSFLASEGELSLYPMPITNLANDLRGNMDVLGPDYSYLMDKIRVVNHETKFTKDSINLDIYEYDKNNQKSLLALKSLEESLTEALRQICHNPPTHIPGLYKIILTSPQCRNLTPPTP